MNSNAKFRLALSLVLLCFMSGCYIPFNDPEEEDFEPRIKTEPGKITAQYYWDFGKIIAADGDHLLVSSYDDIHIFKYNSSGIELIQTIEFEETSGILSMNVYRSELIFGLAESDGTGKVYVYTRNGDAWELCQEIRKGRYMDNFGSAIDIDGETMVIGANSAWTSCLTMNQCNGRVYVYQKREGVWEETQEIVADQSETGDRFGTCVGIYGDLMLAGSPMQPLHLYRFNGDWELLRTEETSAYSIAHYENNFMVSGDYKFRAFILEPDGSLLENTMNSFDNQTITWFVGIIVRDSLAIVNMEYAECCLFKYVNRQWNKEKVFFPDPGEYCTFNGMAITDQYAIIGGMNYENSQFGYVYFREL